MEKGYISRCIFIHIQNWLEFYVYLASKDEDENVHMLYDNTKAVVFYSVPHKGSPLVSLTQAAQLLWWPSVEVQELQESKQLIMHTCVH
jgi:hypothetical protein